jgi:methyltransferase family protein
MKRSRDAAALIRRSTARLYGKANSKWPEVDGWNEYKHRETERFILRTGSKILQNARCILDAGAGDSAYEWMPSTCISLDRHHSQISEKRNAVVGNVERMPFTNGYFNLVVCIGSVLNYASAAETLNEFARITAAGGHIYLHFETSTSFEHLFNTGWGASVHLVRTTNASRPDYIWVYSPKYVRALLAGLHFKVIQSARFHTLSALCCRLGISQTRAHRFARFDRAAALLNYFSDDVVILAQKVEGAVDET